MKKLRAACAIAAGPLVLGLASAMPAEATSASNNLNLKGGDTLQANAWHCGTFQNSCSWANSAKVLGYHPAYASSVTNESEIQAHGISASLTIGSTVNVNIVFTSDSIVRSRWTNYHAWISDSSGEAYPDWSTTYVSSKETASAYDKIFGSPHGLVAYAGICC